jgi:GDP/UDP-N,N'-diacetylbacillosamine 2-epimerase (hydrolysing)
MRYNKRKIAIITGSRGEYGYIRPILKKLVNSEKLSFYVVATNMLLLPEFGFAINQFSVDGIDVKYRIDMSMAGYSNSTMTKSLGVFLQSLTDIIANDKPDIILLAGDRGEQLVGSIVGSHFNIPVAHIQAGELSGNIDGMSRHAITKFAHIHFAANEDAFNRLIKMGEQSFRIFLTGAPQLDEFKEYNYLGKHDFFSKFKLIHDEPYILVLQHSITEESERSQEQMLITLSAIEDLQLQAVLIFPNNDAGSIGIQRAIEKKSNSKIHVLRNVNREDYANLMFHADLMIGNSSSGILEAPTFRLPAINIGRRQIGRLQAKNVINVSEFDKSEIIKAIKIAKGMDFKESIKDISNPYGDGNSSERIIDILTEVEINSELLNKQLTY